MYILVSDELFVSISISEYYPIAKGNDCIDKIGHANEHILIKLLATGKFP